MAVDEWLPGPVAVRVVEWRARRITDPVERLRFLRRTAHFALTGKARLHRRLALGAAVLILGLAPIPLLTNATGRVNRDQGPSVHAAVRTEAPLNVWLVEKNENFEVYSNGLRIETRGAKTERPRSYPRLRRNKPETWVVDHSLDVEWAKDPAGIVFHTTESDLAPFESSQNRTLQRVGRGVLDFVRANRSYHYLIDRFGRVHRVVEEASISNHAGWSIWGDRDFAYVNLNESFLGVAFEAQTRPLNGPGVVNEGQLHSGRVLTGMLRAKYKIPPELCVTHAQVSVNPDNFRIGAHTDWAVQFPFAAMGLPDNYSQPVAGITLFGFTYDSVYLNMSEERLWKGLLLAEDELRQAAQSRKMTVSVYRAGLHRRYKETIDALKRRRPEDGL